MADDLALDQRGAEGLALARPVQRFVVTRLREAERHGAHGQALAVEVAHDHAKARALLAQAVARRHAHAVKAQVGGVGAVPAHLLQRAARDAGPVHGHGDHADAAGAFAVEVCSHCQREPVAAHAGGDEYYFAVDDVVVAVAARGGAQRGHVGAAAGFGDAERRDPFAAQYRGNDLGLQLGRAVREHRGQADVEREQAGHEAAAGAVARQRLRQRVARAPGRGRAAQVLGVAQAEQAEIGRLAVERARDFAGGFPGVELGADAFERKAPDGVCQGLLVGGVEAHAGVSGVKRTRIWPGATCWPSATATSATVPSRGALIWCSIFMLSMASRGCPRCTA